MSIHLRMIFTNKIHQLEYDPEAQYKFNQFFFWFWVLQMPLIAWALIEFPNQWAKIAVFYVAEASLWANLATHFGGMSSALAAKHQDGQIQLVKSKVKGAINVRSKH